VINGTEELNKDMVEEFNQKLHMYKTNEKYKNGYSKIEVNPVDVSKTIKMEKGVDSFWVRAMCNHPNICGHISEKDRAIL
jgi:hypothetical protein|tara:strand:- start:29 stop:268 length:240 start_codon:yes stop_codon:yes gene_type:complete